MIVSSFAVWNAQLTPTKQTLQYSKYNWINVPTTTTLVFYTRFLHATVSEIPEMFQITHRQNHAVKTQTVEGLPVPVTRSQGSRARPIKYCSQPFHLFPPSLCCGLLPHTPGHYTCPGVVSSIDKGWNPPNQLYCICFNIHSIIFAHISV